MIFHTTVLNILVSLCMLLGVCIIIVALAGSALLPSIGNGFIDYLISTLQGDIGIHISIGRMDGSILKSLVLHDVSVTLPSHSSPVLIAKTIILDIPVYRLLSPEKIKGELSLLLVEPVFVFHQADYDFLTNSSSLSSSTQNQIKKAPQLSFALQVVDGALDLQLDTFRISGHTINANVALSGGFIPQQGTIFLTDGSFSYGNQNVSVMDIGLRLGKTPDGNTGLVLNGEKVVLELSSFSSNGAIDSFSASIISPSNDALFQGSGILAANLQSFSADVIYDGIGLAVKSLTIGAESGIEEFVISSLGIHAQQMKVESSIPNLDNLSLKVPDFSGEIVFGPEKEIRLQFDSPGYINAYHEETPLLSLKELQMDSHLTRDLSSLRIGFLTLESYNPSFFNSLFDLDLSTFSNILLSKAHLQLTLDHTTFEKFAELSMHARTETGLELLDEVEADIFADGSLNQQDVDLHADIEVRRLSISGIPGVSELDFAYDSRVGAKHQFETTFSHDSGIQLSGAYDLLADQLRTTIRLDNVHPSDFSTLITRYLPSVNGYFDSQTVIEGNASATFSSDGSQGKGAGELGVAKVRIEEKSFNFASTVAGSIDSNRIIIDSATLTTEGVRATYKGILDRLSLFPEGSLFLSIAETGENLLSVDFSLSEKNAYDYVIFSPILPKVNLTGNAFFDSERLLQAEALLSLPEIIYPLHISADMRKGLFNLNSTAISMLIDFMSAPGHIDLQLKADGFPFPRMENALLSGTILLSGELDIDYALSDGLFIVLSEYLSFTGLSWQDQNPWQLSLSLLADVNEFRINEIVYTDKLGALTGYLHLENNPLHALLDGTFLGFSGKLNLQNPLDISESISISLFNLTDESSTLRGQVIADSLQSSRFFPRSTPLLFDINAIGSSDLNSSIDLNLSVSLENAPWSLSKLRGTFDAEMNNSHIRIIDGELIIDVFSLNGLNLEIPYRGASKLEGSLYIDPPSKFRDMHSELNFTFETVFAPSDDFFSSISIFRKALQQPIAGSLSLSDILLAGSLSIPDGSYDISYDSSKISVSGGFRTNLSGYYEFNTNLLDIRATEDFLFGFHAKGLLSPNRISLLLDSISFPLHLLNPLFIKPVLEFTEGIAHGDLRIEGPSANPKYYGTLWANTVVANTFWTPGVDVSVKNPVITISENRVSVASTPLSATNELGKTVSGYLNLEAGIERWDLPRYKLDIRLRENPVFVWVPIIDKDISLEAMVSGDFSIEGSRTEELLTGELTISDGYLGFGLPDLPDWLVPEQRTSIDMEFTTGKNFMFVYPNRETPIVQAAIADNQRMHIKLDAPTMNIGFNGELAIRSGEIYYVQKNFYITEGSILIKAAVGAAENEVNPLLNLRARLREFDQDGNRVDVYLVLQDSTLNNLAPRFEAIPYRTTNEILEILGQGIIPGAKFEETGIGSVVALATVATDVISRLGIIQSNSTTYGFSQIIRDSLGLDVFTIRTNLLQNILYEAIPGTGTDNSVSPIARYLDNTTLYLGKYLFDDFYLQGMLHFRGDLFSSKEGSSFLSDDLAVDTELSLEWNTPLALFSIFTQPDVLSIFNIFDTIGFSVTKRIVF